jgi:hypothetical protein
MDGCRIPCPWGHQLKARPRDGPDDENYARSRLIAGDGTDLSLAPDGALQATIDLPELTPDGEGNLVNPADGTAISEVSAAVGDWTDGKGITHRDIVNHIALTALPVWAGQDGFRALATGASRLVLLGTGGRATTYTHGTTATFRADGRLYRLACAAAERRRGRHRPVLGVAARMSCFGRPVY